MKLGQIELGRAVTTVASLTKNIKDREDIKLIDVFEFRLDLFENRNIGNIIQTISSLNASFKKPSIATVRSNREGSPISIDDEERFEIFQNVIPLVDAIDIELSSAKLMLKVLPLCRKNKKLFIASYHNFEMTPAISNLEEVLTKSKEIGADIVKIAVKANSKEDVGSLIEFTLKNKNNNLITMSLGSIGVISRIINPFIGSMMTYGYIEKSTAPGQLSIFDVIEELKLYDSEYRQRLMAKK